MRPSLCEKLKIDASLSESSCLLLERLLHCISLDIAVTANFLVGVTIASGESFTTNQEMTNVTEA